MLLAFVTLLATGCATSLHDWKVQGFKVGPDYCPPSASLEVEWIDMQRDPRLSSQDPGPVAWWHSLHDPLLNLLIESSYRQNLTLGQACTRIEQARAIRGIAVGNLFPQVQQAVGDYQRIRTSENVRVPPPIRTFDQFDLGVGAAWELDVWGRFRRSVTSADAALDASLADYDDVALILFSDVASTYVEIRTIQERLRLTRQNAESQRGSLKVAEARFLAKESNKLDVNQAQNNIYITEAAIPTLEAQLRVANNRLCILLGIAPIDLVSEWPDSPIPVISPDVFVGIPADLLSRRPDIRRSERLLLAQSERIGIAEADLYPQISLVGSFEWQATNTSDLINSGSIFSLVSPGFSWNILNYRRIQNAILNEQARFEELLYAYQQNVLTAQQEVENGIILFLKGQDEAAKLAEAVNQVDEAARIATALYESGATDFNRVYVIQSLQFAQQDQLALSNASVVINLIAIYRALGGGWQVRCTDFPPSPQLEYLPLESRIEVLGDDDKSVDTTTKDTTTKDTTTKDAQDGGNEEASETLPAQPLRPEDAPNAKEIVPEELDVEGLQPEQLDIDVDTLRPEEINDGR